MTWADGACCGAAGVIGDALVRTGRPDVTGISVPRTGRSAGKHPGSRHPCRAFTAGGRRPGRNTPRARCVISPRPEKRAHCRGSGRFGEGAQVIHWSSVTGSSEREANRRRSAAGCAPGCADFRAVPRLRAVSRGWQGGSRAAASAGCGRCCTSRLSGCRRSSRRRGNGGPGCCAARRPDGCRGRWRPPRSGGGARGLHARARLGARSVTRPVPSPAAVTGRAGGLTGPGAVRYSLQCSKR
jgi:hypothetical protein